MNSTIYPESSIQFEVKNSIGYMMLNDPPKNEMNDRFFDDLHLLTLKIIPDSALKGLIILGKGRHFSSGADVAGLKKQVHSRNTSLFFNNVSSMFKINNFPIPVVAAINGSCFGSALELAMVCHYRIAGERAIFSFPEVTFDLMPGCGGTIRLSEIVGKSKAIELLLSGRMFLADEAYEIGLIDHIVHKDKVLSEAENLIDKLSYQN